MQEGGWTMYKRTESMKEGGQTVYKRGDRQYVRWGDGQYKEGWMDTT